MRNCDMFVGVYINSHSKKLKSLYVKHQRAAPSYVKPELSLIDSCFFPMLSCSKHVIDVCSLKTFKFHLYVIFKRGDLLSSLTSNTQNSILWFCDIFFLNIKDTMQQNNTEVSLILPVQQ